eukprot:TRINITY_DN42160_c0_g1_i1.p1 TRINITY_DN42160_c0_g1~~TRINITY_DN42160_c0_g1_i1.p1  ORF type:complete len:894 (+),score=175.24 TRINITY_DN42160_c0_g1_i1:65-2746(+)
MRMFARGGYVSVAVIAAGSLWTELRCVRAQVTWGPQPMHLSETDDLQNQRRIHDLLKLALYADPGPVGQEGLEQAIAKEIEDFRKKVDQNPALALGVSMAKYYFSWYVPGTADMNMPGVEDAANLMYGSIHFSGCDRSDLPMEVFLQRLCSVRWPYAVMMYSELGRELAGRYLTEPAAAALERAVAVFDEMKRLPYYAQLHHWQSPYDINFNEAWFPGAAQRGPLWDKSLVPLAAALESNAGAIAAELGRLLESGVFEKFARADRRAEGRDAAPAGAFLKMDLTTPAAGDDAATSRWQTEACKQAPTTCALLSARSELQGCQHISAAFARLGPEGRVKPHFGASPGLRVDLPLRAEPGARMSVGNRTLGWQSGEAIVFDDTFIREAWHAGVVGDLYTLQVTFCHPCDDGQRSTYPSLSCGSKAAAPQAAGLSAAAARQPQQATSGAKMQVPLAAAAWWAATLPELAACNGGISERCPADTQHGGPNPLSALNTWNYALNALRAALVHAKVEIDPALLSAVVQLQGAIQGFFKMPALDHFGPIVANALQIFEAVGPWLQQSQLANIEISAKDVRPSLSVPSDGRSNAATVTFPLANGRQMPAVGFGTWKLEGAGCYDAVLAALRLGIRHIDTAEAYGNEAEVGRALKDSGVPRSEIFLTTKATSVALGMADISYCEQIFAGQLQALQTDYVDIYMLHAAGVKGQQFRTVWQCLERLHDAGYAKGLGVSNFAVENLEELWSFARIKPVYVQNIYKVYKPGEQILGSAQMGVAEWAQQRNVAVVGYSVINSWPHLLPPLQDPIVVSIARSHARTSSQVLHRWALQRGIAVIPKASSLERIKENMALFDFELSVGEMAVLDGLAMLSESTNADVLPRWLPDTFGLHASAAVASPAAR